MDNQNTVINGVKLSKKAVLILVLMDNQNTNFFSYYFGDSKMS